MARSARKPEIVPAADVADVSDGAIEAEVPPPTPPAAPSNIVRVRPVDLRLSGFMFRHWPISAAGFVVDLDALPQEDVDAILTEPLLTVEPA